MAVIIPVCALLFSLPSKRHVSLYYIIEDISDNYSFHFQNYCAVKINDKEVLDSGWFGVEHQREIHTVDLYRYINMETLCKLYPELFPPKVWLSKNAPKITKPKKKIAH